MIARVTGTSYTDTAVTEGATYYYVVRSLDHAHLEPVTLTVREPTLDDVFLSLTGHKAEEPDAEDEAAFERL